MLKYKILNNVKNNIYKLIETFNIFLYQLMFLSDAIIKKIILI